MDDRLDRVDRVERELKVWRILFVLLVMTGIVVASQVTGQPEEPSKDPASAIFDTLTVKNLILEGDGTRALIAIGREYDFSKEDDAIVIVDLTEDWEGNPQNHKVVTIALNSYGGKLGVWGFGTDGPHAYLEATSTGGGVYVSNGKFKKGWLWIGLDGPELRLFGSEKGDMSIP